jgi:multiple sugar transport system permease protein
MRKNNIGKYIILFVAAVIIILPSAYMLLLSFMGEGMSGASGMSGGLISDSFGLNGYWIVFLNSPDYLMKFWASVALAGGIVAGQVLFCSLAGYGFSRLSYPGSNVVFFVIIIMMLMPYQVTLVSSFITLDRMGLIGSYTALWLPAMFSPFGVFLMKQAFDTFPQEICDAALIDGAGHIQTAARIVVPNNRPALAALLILGFADAWNMTEQPLVLLNNTHQYPYSVFLLTMGDNRLEVLSAAGILASVPLLLMFLLFRKSLMEGIAHGRFK